MSLTWHILEFLELTPSCCLTFRPNIRATEAGSSKKPSINTVTMEGVSPWTPRSVLSILNKYWGRFPAMTRTGRLIRLPSSSAEGSKLIESGSLPGRKENVFVKLLAKNDRVFCIRNLRKFADSPQVQVQVSSLQKI